MSFTIANIATANPANPSEAICSRANEIKIKLLDRIEREINDGGVPSGHLEAYETLCRAERTRLGY